MERLKDIAIFICNLMKQLGFRTKELNYHYPATTLEASILSSIEGIEFMGGTGYIFIAGRDYMEYASSDNNLSISWDGSRPNVKHTLLPIPNLEDYKMNTQKTLNQGGGYIQYKWMGKDQTTYILPYDDYLYIGVVSIPELIEPNMVTNKAQVMSSFIAQLTSRFIITNIWNTTRYKPFFQALSKADTKVSIVDGYLEQSPNQAHIPYYPGTIVYA